MKNKTKKKAHDIKEKDLKPKKKITKRNSLRFPALEKKVNLKTRTDLLQDFDYIDKLNDKEKMFLNNFLEEEIITNFNHKGKKFNTSKKSKRRCYNNNNARNRCIMTREKAMTTLNYLPDLINPVDNRIMNPEEMALIMEVVNQKLKEKG